MSTGLDAVTALALNPKEAGPRPALVAATAASMSTQVLTAVAAKLGLSVDALRAQLANGHPLSTVAAAAGLAHGDLVETVAAARAAAPPVVVSSAEGVLL